MTQHDSLWLIKLKYSFQSDTHVFLAMDYIPGRRDLSSRSHQSSGGDLKNLLDHVGCFAEENSLFYFAEMLLAVDALHELGYIHRDLKPDNFMVTAAGHIMLIDFGLSKEGYKSKADTLNFSFKVLSNFKTLKLLVSISSESTRECIKENRQIFKRKRKKKK